VVHIVNSAVLNEALLTQKSLSSHAPFCWSSALEKEATWTAWGTFLPLHETPDCTDSYYYN